MSFQDTAYFISDAHLGAKTPDAEEREARVIAFLESITHNARYLFIVGDFLISGSNTLMPFVLIIFMCCMNSDG